MPAGIGTDIQCVSQFRSKIQESPGFLREVFTQQEQDYCGRFADPAPHFTSRFCAKEAFRKAIDQPVEWLEIEVVNETSGKPVLRLHGKTQQLAFASQVMVTMSHSGDYATATVLIVNNGARKS